jgi:hypothetical protein
MAVELSPFYGIEKGAVLQESRVFNDPQIDVRRCQQIITKLLYLINQGDYFTKVRSLCGACTGDALRACEGDGEERPEEARAELR